MGKFLENEKPIQANFKATSPYFSNQARSDGYYKGKPYPFCLPRAYAHENLFSEIRSSAIAFLAEHEIKWHDGQDGNPSNHLCDSMVCCVNFLFPLSDKPKALAKLLSKIYPDIEIMLPIEDNQYVNFEWKEEIDFLKAVKYRYRERTRGVDFTGANAAVKFQRLDGRVQIVLVEWKYTEAYFMTQFEHAIRGTDLAKKGKNLFEIYAPLFVDDEDLYDKVLSQILDLFTFESYYLSTRHYYLEKLMEKVQEFGADTVSVLHIAPKHNLDIKGITSSTLSSMSDSATGVSKKLVKKPGRFHSISTEELFGSFDTNQNHELKNWYEYITKRYAWVAK